MELACSVGGQRDKNIVRATGDHADGFFCFVLNFDFSCSLLILDINRSHGCALVDPLRESLD